MADRADEYRKQFGNEVPLLELNLEQAKERYLLRKGWARTCSTPHCRWMWEKEFKGKTLLVGMNDAYEIEQYLEPGEDNG